MKLTATHIERLLADIERRIGPPARRMLRPPVVYVYDPGEQGKEKALAKLAADYPGRYAGLTVEDLHWSDELPALKAKAIAEHLAAHPEDANCDFRCGLVHEIVVFHQDALKDEVPDGDDVTTSEATAVAASETSEPEPSETLGILSTPTPEPTDVEALPTSNVVSMRDRPWRPSGRKNGWQST